MVISTSGRRTATRNASFFYFRAGVPRLRSFMAADLNIESLNPA
jgi:hypothetical protein